MSESVEEALQEASTALRRAVELERRREVDEVAAKSLDAEFHELRTVMSTTSLFMRSFDLPRFAGLIGPAESQSGSGEAADPEYSNVALQADIDLLAASDHLRQAAERLTSARRKLAGPA